jgi:hypothetical protein
MKLMFGKNNTKYDSEVFLFLTDGTEEDGNFRILAETTFYDLGTDAFESLEYFIEEANYSL